MSHLASLPLLALALVGCVGEAKALKQRSSQKEDPASLTPWTPPPEYALNTVGHKTMYLADVAIGSAGQTFRLLADTGSSMVIIPGAGISKRSQRFDASGARPGNRTVSVKFGLGAVSGHVFEDRMCVQTPDGAASLTEVGFLQQRSQTHLEGSGELAERSAISGDACAKVSFLVTDTETDDLASEPFDGILGLGPPSSSEQSIPNSAGMSFLSQLVANGVIQSTAFALRLSNSGNSQLLLGGIDESSFAGGRALWVPLSPQADGYWQFSVQDLTLDGHGQQFGGFQVAVDSGTSLLAADDELKDWFREHLLPKDCSDVDHLPKLGLRVGGSILTLLPADYIDQTDGKCSLALMPSPLQSVGGQRLVLGDSFLHRYTTVFDRENGRLGFGVAADDSMAKEILPALFPVAATTVAPATTSGAPPPEHLDYSREEYAPVTTRPPPTASELQATRQDKDLSEAFSGLGDDLASSFENTISHEKQLQGGSARVLSSEALPVVHANHDEVMEDQEHAAANPYISLLKFLQVRQMSSHRALASSELGEKFL